MVRISWNDLVLEPDWNLPNDDIVTIWLDSLSVDFPNGGSRGCRYIINTKSGTSIWSMCTHVYRNQIELDQSRTIQGTGLLAHKPN